MGPTTRSRQIASKPTHRTNVVRTKGVTAGRQFKPNWAKHLPKYGDINIIQFQHQFGFIWRKPVEGETHKYGFVLSRGFGGGGGGGESIHDREPNRNLENSETSARTHTHTHTNKRMCDPHQQQPEDNSFPARTVRKRMRSTPARTNNKRLHLPWAQVLPPPLGKHELALPHGFSHQPPERQDLALPNSLANLWIDKTLVWSGIPPATFGERRACAHRSRHPPLDKLELVLAREHIVTIRLQKCRHQRTKERMHDPHHKQQQQPEEITPPPPPPPPPPAHTDRKKMHPRPVCTNNTRTRPLGTRPPPALGNVSTRPSQRQSPSPAALGQWNLAILLFLLFLLPIACCPLRFWRSSAHCLWITRRLPCLRVIWNPALSDLCATCSYPRAVNLDGKQRGLQAARLQCWPALRAQSLHLVRNAAASSHWPRRRSVYGILSCVFPAFPPGCCRTPPAIPTASMRCAPSMRA